MPTLEARITVSPAPNPTPNPTPAPIPTPIPASIPNLTFLQGFAPAPPTKPLLKSILKRKRQVEVTISSDDDDNRSDLDDGEKELPGDSDYRPGNRPLIPFAETSIGQISTTTGESKIGFGDPQEQAAGRMLVRAAGTKFFGSVEFNQHDIFQANTGSQTSLNSSRPDEGNRNNGFVLQRDIIGGVPHPSHPWGIVGSWDRASYAARRQIGSCEERPRLFRGVLVVPTNVLALKHAKGIFLWTSRVANLEEEGWCAAFSDCCGKLCNVNLILSHASLSRTKELGDILSAFS
ncbi:hypothetical protein F5882DRAFT_442607 [Hyaloscypha sp. PMI_1271]|nr:hypothetical protein F5882DRAFT_442607 [Hyaloscypha sp. PMI_1271]